MTEEEKKPAFKEGEFDEHTSYSFLFFLISGATLFVTLWAFWDDEYARRGFKDFQEKYFEIQYEKTEKEYKEINEKIGAKESEIRRAIEEEERKMEESDEYQILADEAWEAQIHLDEVVEEQKFAKSRLDEYYYYYKKAMHEGKNFDVQLAKVNQTEDEIEKYNPVIEKLTKKRDEAEAKLLKYKSRQEELNKELIKLTNEKIILEGRMDYYKPFPFIWRPAEILQTVIPAYGKNNFAEITYKVDRCQTCHISYGDPYFENQPQPLKTHPNKEIYIDKHDPTVTGCTWCHKGQGAATAPTEHAHGSHHEMDQTVGINEPLLQGNLKQSLCRNCHAPQIELKGAPELTKAKKMFIEVGCHGCHLADGYSQEKKVGPSLRRVASKVDPSWLFRWVKKPRDYLPKTMMPEFSLSDEHAIAISAFLLNASDKAFKPSETFTPGDKKKGKKLFESVGCQACHKLNGNGELHAPDLSNIGNKVNPNWLISWIKNPHDYNPKSKMPDLRLSLDDARDIATYLIQFGKPQNMPEVVGQLKKPSVIALGEKLVRKRGCFGCHEINGMEAEGRIGPELSAFGNKQVRELEFADTHIPHTWDSWARTKLKNPSAYRTERILDKMPNFHFTDDQVNTLMVLLKGFNGVNIPERYRKKYSEKEMAIIKGRKIIERYNCKGCHVVEGLGGHIQEHLKAKTQYPPPLEMGDYHVGERIKSSWLYSFLRNPTPVRKWMKVRMPTFSFSDQEVRELTAYFEAVSQLKDPYEKGVNLKKSDDDVKMGVKIVNYMDCGKCHDDGAKGIEFEIASERLREDWIPKWLKDTRKMIPWTLMPNHWPKEGENYTIATKFSELESVDSGNVDTHVKFITDYLATYNSTEVNTDLVLGEEEEAEESSEGDGEEEMEEEASDDEEAEDEEEDDEEEE